MPWISIAKSASLVSHGYVAPVSGLTPASSFALPLPTKTLNFGPAQFFQSVARGVARHTAPSSVIISQANASNVAISEFLDNAALGFNLDIGISQLNETKVNAIAQDIGVAITLLMMQSMGYRWNALAEDLITPPRGPKGRKGACPDFLCDLGNGVGELVAAEAKGSTGASYASWSALVKRTISGAERQAGNILGHRTRAGALVVHGYGIGCHAPKGGAGASICVQEFNPSSGSRRGARPQRPTSVVTPRSNLPGLSTALSHYKALFRLVGADDVCQFLSDCLGTNESRRAPEFGFHQLRAGGRQFLFRDGSILPGSVDGLWRTVTALETTVARRFLASLREGLSMEAPIELRTIDESELEPGQYTGHSYLAFDGLATLSLADPRLELNLLDDIRI